MYTEKEQQQEHLITVMKMTQSVAAGKPSIEKMHCYILPGSKPSSPICIHMYMRLSGYGQYAMATRKHISSKTPIHLDMD